MKNLIILLLLAGAQLSAQCVHHNDIVLDIHNKPVAGAKIYVCQQPAVGLPCTNLVPLYTDLTCSTPLAGGQPIIGDALGNFDLYAQSQWVTLQFIYGYDVPIIWKDYGLFGIGSSSIIGNAATASAFDHIPNGAPGGGYCRSIDQYGNCVGDPVSALSDIVGAVWPKTTNPAVDCLPLGGGLGYCTGVDTATGNAYCVKTDGTSCTGGLPTGPSGLLDWALVGGVPTATLASAPIETVLSGGPMGGFLTPLIRQTKTCFQGSGSASANCSLPADTLAGDVVFIAAVVNSHPATYCVGGDDGSPTGFTFGDGTNSYSGIDGYSSIGKDLLEDFYAKNIHGGPVTVTGTVTGSTSACFGIMVTEVANVDTSSPLDQHRHSYDDSTFFGVTTTTADEIVIGAGVASYGCTVVAFDPYSWPFVMAAQVDSTTGISVGEIDQVETTTGVYTPVWVGTGCSGAAFTASFKAAAAGGGPAPWAGNYISFGMMTHLVWHNMAHVIPADQSTGDTGIDQHVGEPINVKGQTSAYTGTVLFAVPAGNDLSLDVEISVDCNTATASLVPSFTYTSEDSTFYTITGSTTTCGSAPTSIIQAIRAKAGTNVTLTTASLTNGPHYNIHALVKQKSSQ